MGIQSVFAAASVLAVFALVLLPPLMKRFHLQKILLVGQLASIVFYLLCFIFYKNIPILVICYVASMFATLPGVYAGRLILFDAAIYNEYLGLNRMEGTMNSIFGFMKRAGSALGTFLLGVALTVIQYDAEATTLLPVTEWGLRIMMYGIPLISAALQALLWSAYDLEKRMPKITDELEEKTKSDTAGAVTATE